jgi:hypothetical protein
LVKALEALCVSLNVDHAALAGFNSLDQTLRIIATYPARWQQIYIGKGLYLCDPVLHAALRAQGAVHWSRLSAEPDYESIYAPARAFGIGPHGVSLPMQGSNGDISILSLSRTGPAEHWTRQLPALMDDLQHTAALLHNVLIQTGQVLRPDISAPVAGKWYRALGLGDQRPEAPRRPLAQGKDRIVIQDGYQYSHADSLTAQFDALCRHASTRGFETSQNAKQSQSTQDARAPLHVLALDTQGHVTGGMSLFQSDGVFDTARDPTVWRCGTFCVRPDLLDSAASPVPGLLGAACFTARASGVKALVLRVGKTISDALEACGYPPNVTLQRPTVGPGAEIKTLVYDCAKIVSELPENERERLEAMNAEATNAFSTIKSALKEVSFLSGPSTPFFNKTELTGYCLEQIGGARDAQSLKAALALSEAILDTNPKPLSNPRQQ